MAVLTVVRFLKLYTELPDSSSLNYKEFPIFLFFPYTGPTGLNLVLNKSSSRKLNVFKYTSKISF